MRLKSNATIKIIKNFKIISQFAPKHKGKVPILKKRKKAQ